MLLQSSEDRRRRRRRHCFEIKKDVTDITARNREGVRKMQRGFCT